MVSPEFFRVEYAINPYMKTPAGVLQKVDVEKAKAQWRDLRATYERLGFSVDVIPGHPELPDMVFAANQSFTYWDSVSARPKAILSRMRSDFRQPEVAHFAKWYEEHDYLVEEIAAPGLAFEGNGDAIPHADESFVWGGVGPRTDAGVYDQLKAQTGLAVVPLRLRMADFYHLDTCFSILDAKTVAIQEKAFDAEGLAKIRAVFSDVISLDLEECLRFFAGNCHCPDGKNVLLHPGAVKFNEALKQRGYQVHEVDTSEYLKSGGSVFCMKMQCY